MVSTIERTLCHVVFLARHLDICNLRGAIVVVLLELGVPTKCGGFEYLIKAIEMQHKDPTRLLAKDIYLEISQLHNLNSEKIVEQAIREVINSAWKYGSQLAWEWYFSYDGHVVSKKPTNGEFISRIAYILEIWQDCKEIRRNCNERE